LRRVYDRASYIQAKQNTLETDLQCPN